jgi:uncharacterized membrane protein
MRQSASVRGTTTSTGLKPALLYAVLALIGGAAFAILVPPLQAPDEAHHFARAYQVAGGVLVPSNRRGELGGVLPSNIAASIRIATTTAWHAEARITEFGSQYREFQVPVDPAHTSFTEFPNTAVEPPFAYLPQAVGIRVARQVSDTVLSCLFGARLGNVLIAVFFIAWAIYLTPVFRWVLVFIALSPLSLGVVATATSYGFTQGMLFLFCAAVFRAAYRPTPELSRGAIAALVATAIGMSLVSQGYFPLLLLFLLIPAARLGNRARYWLLVGGLVVIALAGCIAWELIAAGPLKAENSFVVQARQLLDHPRQIGQVAIYGIGPPVPLVAKTLGGPLVTDRLNLGPLVSIPFVILMLMIAFLDFAPSVGRVTLGKRIIPWAVVALCAVAISLLMYLTLPAAYFNQRMHPRQVIPVGFLLLLFFLNAMPHAGRIGRFVRGHFGWFALLYFVLRMAESLFVLNQSYYSLSS